METQNEQKANEIVDKFYGNFVPFHAHSKAFEECAKAKNAVLDAMQWKDEQFLQWLKENLTKETFTMFTSESQGVINFEPVIKEFEKFIKH